MMATIAASKRGIQYTARLEITRGGEIIFWETETFTFSQLAKQWAVNREAQLANPRELEEALLHSVSFGQVLNWYKLDYSGNNWGRTKLQHINQLIGHTIANLDALSYTSGQIVEHVRKRRAEGAGPSTVNNDLIWLRNALRGARIGRDVPISLQPLDAAAHLCRKERLIAKSWERDRRPTVEEMLKIVDYFRERDRRSEIPMTEIILFALFSSRRQDEICRIRWLDLDKEARRVLVRDMKVLSRDISSLSRQQSSGASILPGPTRKTVPMPAENFCLGLSSTYAKVQFLPR